MEGDVALNLTEQDRLFTWDMEQEKSLSCKAKSPILQVLKHNLEAFTQRPFTQRLHHMLIDTVVISNQ